MQKRGILLKKLSGLEKYQDFNSYSTEKLNGYPHTKYTCFPVMRSMLLFGIHRIIFSEKNRIIFSVVLYTIPIYREVNKTLGHYWILEDSHEALYPLSKIKPPTKLSMYNIVNTFLKTTTFDRSQKFNSTLKLPYLSRLPLTQDTSQTMNFIE